MTQASHPRRLILRPDEVRELVRCGSVVVVRPRPRQDSVRCPFGAPGSLLWVAETWCPIEGCGKPASYFTDPKWKDRTAFYEADNDRPTWAPKWRSSTSMPRRFSRLTVRVTSVEVAREGDAWQWRVRVEREGEGASDGE